MSARIQTLDGIRGLAVVFVIAGHVCMNLRPLDEGLRHWLVAFANPGLGVRLFFVLSGYLITQLLLAEQARSGEVDLSRFYWRRALRIFPAFYVYLLAMAALQLWWPVGVNPATFVAAATYTWNYSPLWISPPPEGTWALGHFWTLALEQQFYLFWPVAMAMLRPRRALTLAVVLIVWCPLARLATYAFVPGQRGLLNMMFHTGIDSLMIGCATALLLRSIKVKARLRHWGTPGVVVAGVWALIVSPLTAEWVRGSPLVLGMTLDGLAAAWVSAWAHECPSPWAVRFLGRGLWPAVGAISYSLYLWQQIFLRPDGGLAHGSLVWPLAGAIAAALISYWCVEKPVLRLKNRSASPVPVITTPPILPS